jgi:hypothetical protein
MTCTSLGARRPTGKARRRPRFAELNITVAEVFNFYTAWCRVNGYANEGKSGKEVRKVFPD